jgi:hypothetical protein
VRPGETVEFIPGHRVRAVDRLGPRQFSDGLVVARNAKGEITRAVAIVDSKAGGFRAISPAVYRTCSSRALTRTDAPAGSPRASRRCRAAVAGAPMTVRIGSSPPSGAGLPGLPGGRPAGAAPGAAPAGVHARRPARGPPRQVRQARRTPAGLAHLAPPPRRCYTGVTPV